MLDIENSSQDKDHEDFTDELCDEALDRGDGRACVTGLQCVMMTSACSNSPR